MSFPRGHLKHQFRSVLGPHADRDRPKLRAALACVLGAHWRTDTHDTARHQHSARKLSDILRARMAFHGKQGLS